MNDLAPNVRIFDSSCSNFNDDAAANYLFIKGVTNYLIRLLQARGHLFLNDAFDAFDFRRSSFGAINGWIVPQNSYVDISCDPEPWTMPKAKHMLKTDPIKLTFNVFGVMYDRIDD